jgi:hypothetical protein
MISENRLRPAEPQKLAGMRAQQLFLLNVSNAPNVRP